MIANGATVKVFGVLTATVECHLFAFNKQPSYRISYTTDSGKKFWSLVPEYVVKEVIKEGNCG